jgi:hypothetical protein
VNEDYGCQEMKGIFQMQRNAWPLFLEQCYKLYDSD